MRKGRGVVGGLLFGALLLLLTACPPGVGNLQVSISGLSGGTNANVTVSGPNSFNQVLTASQTLTNLEPGSYTITAGDARDGDPLVSELFAGVVVGSPATVSSGATANATVSYSKRAGTGHLWVPHRSTTIASGYAASQLLSSGSPTPGVIISGMATVDGGLLALNPPPTSLPINTP